MSKLRNYFYDDETNLILYKGENYYDDRIFHLHLTLTNKQTLPDGIVTREVGSNLSCDTYTLITRRNSIGRKPIRADDFESYDEAIAYIERIEPEVPLISLNGNPIIPKPSIEEYKEMVKEKNWLPTYLDI